MATGRLTGLAVANILEAIRTVNREIPFYQASTSQMFGKVREVPQNGLASFYPPNPYAVAKLYGHWITVTYRESYGLYACCGIFSTTSRR